MAGHSQFKNIMHRKNAQDQKKAKMFTKIAHEIVVAVQSKGADPETNAKLRSAIAAAREINMPKEKIENAIKKASSAERDSSYYEMRYEGFGPGGVAIMIFALSDNMNRTASSVRSAFAKHGGSLGESGSVGYLFQNICSITYSTDIATEDAMFEDVLSIGADDLSVSDCVYCIKCAPHMFNIVKEFLFAKYGRAISANLVWVPITKIDVDIETAKKNADLIYALEESDDVQDVVVNIDLPESK